jgi:hypothetical protein
MIILWLGGMITPWQALVTVMPTEKSVSYPDCFIIGISIAPIEEVSAMAEPEIPPKNILESTFTWASPPLIRPTITFENLMSLVEIPPWDMISPARIKKGIAIREKEWIPFTICSIIAIRGTCKYMAVIMDEAAKAKVIGILMTRKTKKEPISRIIGKFVIR